MNKKSPFYLSLTVIAVVVLLLLVFVLTATWLPSVFLGLLLAILVAPIQLYFYRKWFITQRYRAFLTALTNLRLRFLFRKGVARLNEADFLGRAASHAAIFTTTALIVLCIVLFALILGSSTQYMADKGRDFRAWIEREDVTHVDTSISLARLNELDSSMHAVAFTLDEAGVEHTLTRLTESLEKYTHNDAESSIAKTVLTKLTNFLSIESNRTEIATFIIKQSRIYFPPLMGVLGATGRFLFDLFMLVVFFSLFLQLIARFGHSTNQTFTEGLLNSQWLPRLTKPQKQEISTLINGVIDRIKAWLVGFCLIALIEIPCYIILFSFIGIPYAVVLGAFSGCMLFLPVVGPIVVVSLTFILTIASPDVTVTQMLMLAGVYALMIGFVELLILYPRIVGGRLNLTLIELLVAVLLGGYLFGLMGMFFALPTAAILKYLVPKIYETIASDHGSNLS